MRKLDRTKVSCPAILADLDKEGKQETLRAIAAAKAYRALKDKKAKFDFKFSAYRDSVVKERLGQLSHNKCAYCECEVLANSDGDIEHFRPKGEVITSGGESLKPGYYWLAADWENLFLSCQHCNQSRVQPLQDGTKATRGKKNQFPLSDENKRVKTENGNLEKEDQYRLILNPCIDDPEKHLMFDEKGRIYPAKLKDVDSPKGKATIEVFALYRMHLVNARGSLSIKLISAIQSFEDHLDSYQRAKRSKRKADIEQAMKKMLRAYDGLQLWCKENQPYTAMAKQIINNRLKRYNIELKDCRV